MWLGVAGQRRSWRTPFSCLLVAVCGGSRVAHATTAEEALGTLRSLAGSLPGGDDQGAGGELLQQLLTPRTGGEDPLAALLEGLSGLQQGLSEGDEHQGRRLCGLSELAVPKMDQHFFLTANGCGPQGLQVKEPFGLHRCCNVHDICFSVCGTAHSWCEEVFSTCMQRVCEQPLDGRSEECRQMAESFAALTSSFGKGFHLGGQQRACECMPRAAAEQRQRDYLMSFYKRHDKELANAKAVDRILNKWRGKEGQLYVALVREYGRQFVRFVDVEPEFAQDAIAHDEL